MIKYEHVGKTYDEPYCEAVKDFSLWIKPGEFYAMTGESGSGKTTLLELIMKEIEPTNGKVIVDGKDISLIKKGELPMYRRSLGMIFQDFRLIPDINAFENVRLAMILADGNMKTSHHRVTSVFSMLGITHLHKKLPREMSGGEQQKVCLARAIVNQPRILLCDEPTGNLDPKASDGIFELLKLINMQGVTILLATHDIERVNALGVKLVELRKEGK